MHKKNKLEHNYLEQLKDLQQKYDSLKKNYNTVVDKLQQEEQRFRKNNAAEDTLTVFFEQIAIGVAQIETATGRFVKINSRYSGLVGYAPEEMIGTDFMQITFPEDLDEDLRNMQRLIVGEVDEFTMEKRYISKSGKIVWVQLTVSPMWKKGELPDYHIAVVQDITARKQAEKAIIESQRLNAIGEMAASIAHDFNNSLQAIMGHIEVARLGAKTEADMECMNNITSIVSGVGSRIKALQRFGDKKADKESYAPANLNAIIDDCILQLKPLWKNRAEKEGVVISINRKYADIPDVYCNAGELNTMFHNIIKNSIEAMPRGGEINITTLKINRRVVISIADSGVGMDEETKSKIFQPFYTTKGFELGRGLGMSGVYSIVKEHEGDIVVRNSQYNKGTTIEISFPFVEQKKNKTKVNIKQDIAVNSKPLSILWVEDEEILQMHSRKLVESFGHLCDVAANGENALIKLDAQQYDIVITDIGMPKMNGWELVKAIRNKFGNAMKIAVVSGWSVELKDAEAKGVNYLLDKPFNTAQLKKLFLELQR